jgi:hypothetical protein
MIMQSQVQALQDEVHRLIAKLDESEARVDALEALLHDAILIIDYLGGKGGAVAELKARAAFKEPKP